MPRESMPQPRQIYASAATRRNRRWTRRRRRDVLWLHGLPVLSAAVIAATALLRGLG